jgi:hypothetical protein
MKPKFTSRTVRRSFTLTSETFEFLKETRKQRGTDSNSEALEMLLREAMLEAKRQQIEAAVKEYYDTASEQDLAEQSEWARMGGPNVLREAPEL